MDATLEDLLTATAMIARPRVELDADGGPRTPVYEATGESARVRITPARSASRDGLLGRVEDVTHVIYTEPADIRMGDRLVTRPRAAALSEDVEAGVTVLPVDATEEIRDGETVEIGAEERLVVAVTEESVTVASALAGGYEEGEAVRVVVRYEVLGVEDAGGMGHHLRLTAAEGG
jgi:predicted RecA/RadA family phage recombinase